ncbi:MAG: hypothetical protein A3H39_16440 [candidate division NC10 bacterium RIFCSPLOWO2_02_FULL_66_22]|nr:MAG: hypothetical protein A3H39_16440 [candidate division NC10 bacterium RIFCSPLOWO2_02_FULL_66_22]
MRRLIDQGFEISGSLDSITGDTALHYASRHGREGMVSLLLKSGADVDASNKYGTPLTVACGEGNLAVIKLLIAAGANVNHRSAFSGDTPLHYACGSDSADAARMLLDHGADVNAANHSAETPLFEACKSRLDIVKLLVERGADIQRGNKNRQTALRFAEANDRNDIVRYLESQGIKQRAKVAVLVFLFEVTEPPRQDAEAICAPILRVHCPDDELGRAFVVGRMDRFSANVAMSVYLQYVMNRQLPDLGANFMIAELPSGEGLALLFRPA